MTIAEYLSELTLFPEKVTDDTKCFKTYLKENRSFSSNLLRCLFTFGSEM